MRFTRLLRFAAALAAGASIAVPLSVGAQPSLPVTKSAESLMVVLRESPGANKQDEKLVAFGKAKVKLPDGQEVEFEPAYFEFLGDMHVRFVFDGPQIMASATPQDLARLNLTPEQALSLGIANIERVYGKPTSVPWDSGLLQVKGKSPDLDSSYFLDRAFWQELSKSHPEGIAVSVPKRGGLLYAPLSDVKAVEGLRHSVAGLFASSGTLRVSSAVYLFKENRWSVLQPAGAR